MTSTIVHGADENTDLTWCARTFESTDKVFAAPCSRDPAAYGVNCEVCLRHAKDYWSSRVKHGVNAETEVSWCGARCSRNDAIMFNGFTKTPPRTMDQVSRVKRA